MSRPVLFTWMNRSELYLPSGEYPYSELVRCLWVEAVRSVLAATLHHCLLMTILAELPAQLLWRFELI